MKLRLIIVSLAFLLVMPGASFGANGKTVQLNQEKIHWEYSEGNFDTVTGLLEGFLKSKSFCNQADSVFLNKHLGVIYAANPQTREKGRHYLLKMLEVSPNTDLSDMFVSEEIDAVFAKVKLENDARRKFSKVDKSELLAPPWKNVEPPKNEIYEPLTKNRLISPSATSPARKSADPKLKTDKSSSYVLMWVMTSTGFLAVAAGTYFYLAGNDTDKNQTVVFTIPENVSNP